MEDVAATVELTVVPHALQVSAVAFIPSPQTRFLARLTVSVHEGGVPSSVPAASDAVLWLAAPVLLYPPEDTRGTFSAPRPQYGCSVSSPAAAPLALVPSERLSRTGGTCRCSTSDGNSALWARRWLPGRDLVVVGDSGFSALLFRHAMRRARVSAITRLRLEAALYDPVSPRPPDTIGRPRTTRLAVAYARGDSGGQGHARWHAVVVPSWYGAGMRTSEIASDTAVWRHGGLPVVPIRSRAHPRFRGALPAPGPTLHRSDA
ncbi:hypothetical protein [Methylobacterium sp. GXS13]|uniref:hypothetical protein n=1 Tax=Methylobacterium sp. GXS13 TaxID=1730094 RepID=UPI001FCD6FEF|nr:hypothetical protein [Methylobacterium sp. GXS13]